MVYTIGLLLWILESGLSLLIELGRQTPSGQGVEDPTTKNKMTQNQQ